MALTLNLATKIPQELEKSDVLSALTVIQAQVKNSTDGQINLSLVDKATSQRLNKQFARNDYPTDVLSFDYFENEKRESTKDDEKGEIVICLPVAIKQASDHSWSLKEELLLLFVHGVLHLLGLDHDNANKASFEDQQSAIMLKLTGTNRDIFI